MYYYVYVRYIKRKAVIMIELGKNDLIEKIVELKINGKNLDDSIFQLAEKIYNGEFELTGTLKRSLKKYNYYKKLGKFAFCEYIVKAAKTFYGQTFGRID